MRQGKRMPERWTGHDWGPASTRQYVRADQSNPHGGDYAIVVRGMSDGSLPGVYSSVKSMPPATYRLSFWACADIDETACVHAHLAGEEMPARKVCEEYEKITFTMEVQEGKRLNPPIRLWTSTAKVKVWFDDVEVVAIGKASKKAKE